MPHTSLPVDRLMVTKCNDDCSCQKKSVAGSAYSGIFADNKITQCLNSAFQFM